jgi:cysteine desulfurase/selenocysteine lyase
VALLLGAQTGVIVFGESTTANAFRILRAIISSQPGDNVVTTNLDHPAVYDSTQLLAAWYGKQWRTASLNPRTGAVELSEVLRHVDSRTIVLALIHSSNVNGAINDVKTIIREARALKPDLYVLVDGAQHAPHGPVDVHDLGCDAYLVSSYKFFSKMGASCAYLSDRAASLPHEQITGKPGNAWDLGTREVAGYAAWTLVVDYLCWLGGHFVAQGGRKEMARAGIQAIQAHERALHNLLVFGGDGIPGLSQLERLQIHPQGHSPDGGPLSALTVRHMPARQVVNWLEEEGFRVHERVCDGYSKHTLEGMGIEECVRVSLAHYNSPQEVTAFLQTMGRLP